VVPLASADTTDPRDQSVGELLKELSKETSTLVRQELELAKAEMREKGRKAGPGLGMLGGSGVAALLALGTLTAFVILALDEAMPAWVAALIVTLVWGGVAAFLYVRGRERVEEAGSPAPKQTIETLKEDVEWAKHPTRSATR
jgi:uncharacterized membrane protein YqjE